MTEKMLIVILSTNAPTKRMKFKAITEKKKTIKKIIFLWQGSNLCDDHFCDLFFAISLTLLTPQLFGPNDLKVYNTSKYKETQC